MRKGFDQIKAEQSNGFNQAPNSGGSNSGGSSSGGSSSSASAPQMSNDPMNNPNPAFNELEDKEKKKGKKGEGKERSIRGQGK